MALQLVGVVVIGGWRIVELGFLLRLFSACIILFSVVTKEWNKANNYNCFVLGWEAEGKGWRERRGEKISSA